VPNPGVPVDVGVGVAGSSTVTWSLGVFPGVGVGVPPGVGVGVPPGVDVGVSAGVAVGVSSGGCVGVSSGVGVAVAVAVAVEDDDSGSETLTVVEAVSSALATVMVGVPTSRWLVVNDSVTVVDSPDASVVEVLSRVSPSVASVRSTVPACVARP